MLVSAVSAAVKITDAQEFCSARLDILEVSLSPSYGDVSQRTQSKWSKGRSNRKKNISRGFPLVVQPIVLYSKEK